MGPLLVLLGEEEEEEGEEGQGEGQGVLMPTVVAAVAALPPRHQVGVEGQ